MASMIPYIVFNGSCKQAIEFYAQVLEGEIVSMRTFGESPLDVPAEHKSRIFDSAFEAGDIYFRASDDLPGQPVTIGSNISLFVSFTDKAMRKNVFDKLAGEGKILFPLEDNFGMLKDKFGLQWMFPGE